jgi:hypothetical protein
MRRLVTLALAILAFMPLAPAQPAPASDWQTLLDRELPLLGHRNWILIVDSAYPLQASSGVETIDTGADQLEVVQYVLAAVNRSIHVRPDVFMDAELRFVPESDAPGVTAYRDHIARLLDGLKVIHEPHDNLINQVDQAGKLVHILVLKTRLAVPYTSVFLRLNCKYWSDDAEKRLRANMPTTP